MTTQEINIVFWEQNYTTDFSYLQGEWTSPVNIAASEQMKIKCTKQPLIIMHVLIIANYISSNTQDPVKLAIKCVHEKFWVDIIAFWIQWNMT